MGACYSDDLIIFKVPREMRNPEIIENRLYTVGFSLKINKNCHQI